MRYLLAETAPLLSELAITYWLDRGTLLGAYRERTLINGDYDIDVRFMQRDWLKVYRCLQENLPSDLTVSAMHHGSTIHEADHEHRSMWFENEDGEFPVAEQEGELNGHVFHTATALVVHFHDAAWNQKPNFDLYSCRINRHHDCMPADSPRPWDHDGLEYLCAPSRRPQSMLVPTDYVFPLSSVRLEAMELPAPGKIETYLRHLLGYLGENAMFNEATGYWEPRGT